MIRPTFVEPLPNYRLRVGFKDGTQGIIDLTPNVGWGVFAPLAVDAYFRTVHLGEYGQIAWSEELEICSDAVYAEITGHLPVEHAHAGG